MSKRITQRESAQWRKRALSAEEELRKLRTKWVGDLPSWNALGRIPLKEHEYLLLLRGSVKTANSLKHAVVAVIDGEELVLFACEVQA